MQYYHSFYPQKKPKSTTLNNDLLGHTRSRAQQNGEIIRYRKLSSDKREPSSRRSVHHINPTDTVKLYDDAQEDPTLNWVVPNNLYKVNADGTSRIS